MQIAFLGLGKMGSAMARHLVEAGHKVTVWNRTRAHAEPLGNLGARVADSAVEAVAGAEVVLTMLFDDAALNNVLLSGGVLKKMGLETIHVSLSTISVALSDRLTELHRSAGQEFVAAPVFGRPDVAAAGKLFTVAAGEPVVVAKIHPLLETFSRGVTVISDKPSAAHALKLGGNFLITAMIASLSESLVFARALGIEPAVFLDTVNAALFRSPFYEAYGKIMLNPPKDAGGSIALGRKDLRMFRMAAAGAFVKTPLANIFAESFDRAIDAGMQDADWAAGYYELIQDVTRVDR
jgi:3-hydroxyisobutyrate dehydrogenase-like beta-hydroxyacid dehydrogenase